MWNSDRGPGRHKIGSYSMREQKWKIKVNARQLFMLCDLVEAEGERLAELSRTGVGLQATAAWDKYGDLWPIFQDLKRMTQQP